MTSRYIPDKTCMNCGGPISWRAGQQIRAKIKFCGNPCKFAWQKRNPANPRVPREIRPCGACGKPVEYLPSQRGPRAAADVRSENVYCDRKCKGIGHSKLMTGRRPSNGVYTSVSTFRTLTRRLFIDRCALCGWNEAPCDVAHIIAGGGNVPENVTMLCPNHHRMYDRGLISEAEVRRTRASILR